MKSICLFCMVALLTACSSENPSSGIVSATRIPAECVSQGSVSHTFLSGDTKAATHYACDSFNKLDCDLYDPGDNSIEMLCKEANPADPQGIPPGCTYASGSATSTAHDFVGVGMLFSATYTCPAKGVLSCSYFQHPGNACNDTNGTPVDDCGPGEDDVIHEEVRCVIKP